MSCATVSRNPSGVRQQAFNESLFCPPQLVEEVRLTLSSAFDSIPHGMRKRAPKLTNLVSNSVRVPCVNHFAENAVSLSLGLLALTGRDNARRFPQVLDSIICARSSEPSFSLDELQTIETKVEGQMNDIQMAYTLGDKSHRRKLQLLDVINKALAALENMKAALVKDIYGASKQ